MTSEKLNFEADLWGQYDKLHERLKKKKTYVKSLLKSLEPICESFKDLLKKLESFKIPIDPTISQSLYSESETSEKESKLYGISLTIDTYIKICQKLIDNSNSTFFHITTGLDNLSKIIQSEKDEYNNLLKCLKSLSDNKNIMEKNMRLYHQKMSAAENSVRDFKKAEIIQLSINNDTANIENKNVSEENATKLTNDAVKPFNIYLDSVKKVNEIRVESIEKQKNLLYIYQNIEEEFGKSNQNFSKIILISLENIHKELNDVDLNKVRNIINKIHINREIKQLILDNRGNEKPEEEILFINFPSIIKFEDCNDNKTFEIYTQIIEFIKNICEGEYPNYDEQLEKDKNDMREMLSKLFEKFENEKARKIKELMKNENMHLYFLILLSKLRTNNRYEQKKELIDYLGDILYNILDKSEKTQNFNNAKNCIILSQTFYYDKDGYKYYITEKIKKHKWISKPDYWFKFGELMLEQEINKFLGSHPDLTKEDIINNSEKITKNLQKKLSDIMYTQLLPLANNMKEFGINLKNIVEIIERIIQKYDFLSEEEKKSIFELISDNEKEINNLRKDYIKENNNIKKEENEIKIIKDSNGKKFEIKNENKNNEINIEIDKNLKLKSIINSNLNKKLQKDNENYHSDQTLRSVTIDLSSLQHQQQSTNEENNKVSGFINQIKNKFKTKDKKINENENKKENKKDNKIEQKNIIKKDMGNQMLKINFNPDQLLPLKPRC